MRSFDVTLGRVGNVRVVSRIDGNRTVFDLDQFASAKGAAAVAASCGAGLVDRDRRGTLRQGRGERRRAVRPRHPCLPGEEWA